MTPSVYDREVRGRRAAFLGPLLGGTTEQRVYNECAMDPEDLGQDPDKPRPRPKVVDKRVSSRGTGGESEGEPPATPPAAGPEPGLAPDQPEHGDTPGAGSAAAASQDASQNVWTPEQEERAQQLAQEIAQTPSLEWVVNTAVTLANVAGTKLDLGAAADAQLAIDALAGILDAAGSRLEGAEAPLRQTLAQLRLAYAERVGN
jgi:hypothetical protein